MTTSPALAAPGCAALRWVALGTAGGPIPTPERTEPANLLIAGDQAILVDTGDGTVNQLAKAGRDLGSVRTAFISHHHLDHTGGLAAVVGLRWMNNHPGVLTVYGPPGTREIVDGILTTMQPQARVGFGLGRASSPPKDAVRVVELRDGSRVELGALVVTAAGNSHFDHPGPKTADEPVSLSYRFQLGARSITYSGDTGPSASLARLAAGTDMLVSEVIELEPIVASIRAQRPDLSPAVFEQMRHHLSTHHITATDLGQLANEAGAGRLVLTHFAIPAGPLELQEPALRAGIAQSYRGAVDLARDLSSFDVGCRPDSR